MARRSGGTDWGTWGMVTFVPVLIRILTATLRVRYEGLHYVDEAVERRRPMIAATWHQNLIYGVGLMGRYSPIIMISGSRDGRRAARIAESLGWDTVSGSTSSGGARGLIELIRMLRGGRVACHIVDGPRGPARRVKPGIVLLASRTGASIVPALIASRRRWVAKSWDRLQIPLPFTHVLFRFGTPIEVPRDLSDSQAEAIRQEIEKQMEQGHAELEAEFSR